MVKNLQVHSEDQSIDKRTVHSLIAKLKSHFKLSISFLTISIIDSDKLRAINKKHLKHDFNTDVISFNYSKKSDEIDGEILISFEQAKINAKKYRVNYNQEICRLIIHGILHLLNYDDNNKKNRTIMKQMENKLLNKYNFTLFAGKY